MGSHRRRETRLGSVFVVPYVVHHLTDSFGRNPDPVEFKAGGDFDRSRVRMEFDAVANEAELERLAANLRAHGD